MHSILTEPTEIERLVVWILGLKQFLHVMPEQSLDSHPVSKIHPRTTRNSDEEQSRCEELNSAGLLFDR